MMAFQPAELLQTVLNEALLAWQHAHILQNSWRAMWITYLASLSLEETEAHDQSAEASLIIHTFMAYPRLLRKSVWNKTRCKNPPMIRNLWERLGLSSTTVLRLYMSSRQKAPLSPRKIIQNGGMVIYTRMSCPTMETSGYQEPRPKAFFGHPKNSLPNSNATASMKPPGMKATSKGWPSPTFNKVQYVWYVCMAHAIDINMN